MSIQNLDQRFPIVNPDGTPTEYFMRLIRDRGSAQSDSEATIESLSADKADKVTQIATGFGLSGGGNLSADRTLSLGNPALTDPNNDRGVFWDDSAGRLDWLTFGSGLSVSGTTLSTTGAGAGGLISSLYADSGTAANTSLQVLATDTIAANTVADGDVILLEAFFNYAATTRSRYSQIRLNSVTLTGVSSALSTERYAQHRAYLTRTGSTTARMYAETRWLNSSLRMTFDQFGVSDITGLDFTIDQALDFTGTVGVGAVANDIVFKRAHAILSAA